MLSPRRLFTIAIVAGVTFYVVNNHGSRLPVKQVRENPIVKQSAGTVSGVATNIFNKGASASANIVSNLVVQKASEPLMKEYEKLKPEQQEIIKKQICK